MNTSSPDDRLRMAALRALATLGDDRAVPMLLEWSATGQPFPVRSAAVSSLGRLGKNNKEITQKLLAYLREPYRSVRLASLWALGERGDPDAAAPIETLVQSGELEEGLRKVAEAELQRLKRQPAGAPAGGEAGQPAASAEADGQSGAAQKELKTLQELRKLQSENAELKEQVKKLQERLAAAEKK